VLLFDVKAEKLVDLPGLNSPKYDERMPCLSADGRWLAYVSNRAGGAGLSDIYVYDRKENKVIELPYESTSSDFKHGETLLVAKLTEDEFEYEDPAGIREKYKKVKDEPKAEKKK